MSDSTKIGTVCHIEIPAPDLAVAKSFFADVFGWKMDDVTPNYAFFFDGATGGAFDADLPVAEGGLRLYVEVEDIDKTLARIGERGGETVKGKTGIGSHGYYAHFRDPNGNLLGIHSS